MAEAYKTLIQMNQIKRVLKLKKLSIHSKCNKTKDLMRLIKDKIDRIDLDIQAIYSQFEKIKIDFFVFQGRSTVSEKEVQLYIEQCRKLNNEFRQNKKNIALLKHKLFEQSEVLKHHHDEIIKIDIKREFLNG